MHRYKLTIEYNGRGYNGWQVQKNQPSVQQHLEEALFRFCGALTPTICAGRTDAGVHALGQVVHVDFEHAHDPYRIMQGINFHLLPHSIAIVHVENVKPDFSARFDAVRRHYRYRIVNRRARLALDAGRAWHVPVELNISAMREGANLLVGHHDFSSFRASECQAKSPVKTLENLDIKTTETELNIDVSARSFLHHQVRNMVGTLVYVGHGKLTPQDIPLVLEAKNRAAAGPTAPAEGLYFMRVEY